MAENKNGKASGTGTGPAFMLGNGLQGSIEGDTLTLKVNLKNDCGLSSTGKSRNIATTNGNKALPGHPSIRIGVNVYSPVTE